MHANKAGSKKVDLKYIFLFSNLKNTSADRVPASE